MLRNNHSWRWTGAFSSLFLLSQDYWFWDSGVQLGPGNFPLRIYYFLLLQLLLAVLLAAMIRAMLRDDSRKPD